MASAYWSAIWLQGIIFAACYELHFPPDFTSLSDDLKIQLLNISWHGSRENASTSLLDDYAVVELLTEFNASEARAFTKVRMATSANAVPTAVFPCNLLWHGGRYWLRHQNSTVPLDVRWYNATLKLDSNTPPVIKTFEDSVNVHIKFYDLACTATSSLGNVSPNSASQLQLQLVFCGHSEEGCRPGSERAQILHSEEIWPGFEPLRVNLSCELFGTAGRYIIWLLGTAAYSNGHYYVLDESQPLHAEWSDQYVFNVLSKSIFPCDTLPSANNAGGGSRGEQSITVLFQYPQCILPDTDRVRVYGRIEEALTSVDPNKLIYITEQRVLKGTYRTTFPCAQFSETYLEYCFVYVSGARSGASSNVRENCVPTLPVGESEAGAWGAWSSWTQCSTSCGGGGIRNRYRYCDSPPPRYGAQFCKGKTLQTERCPEQTMCPDGGWSESGPGAALPADSELVQAEVGPGCRCGCVVYLGTVKPRRLLAASSQSCPGRTLWLVQAEDEKHVIELNVEHFRLACEAQWMKVRDGDSLAATLIAHLTSDSQSVSAVPVRVRSSASHLLIEFFSGLEPGTLTSAAECRGGFLAHAQQIVALHNVTVPMVNDGTRGGSEMEDEEVEMTAITLTSVHLAALSFVALVLLLSAALGAQYTFRYRKYQRAAAAEPGSPTHSLPGSTCSTNVGSLARFTSSTTLSEIISLRRFGAARRLRSKHERLKEDSSRVDEQITVMVAKGAPTGVTLAREEEDEGEESSSGGGGLSSTDDQETAGGSSQRRDTSADAISSGSESAHTSKAHVPQAKPSPTMIRRSLNFSPQKSDKRRRGRHKAGHRQRICEKKNGAVSPVTEEEGDRSRVAQVKSSSNEATANSAASRQITSSGGDRDSSASVPSPHQSGKRKVEAKEDERTPPYAKASKEKQNRARCLQIQQTKKGPGGALARGNNPMHQRVLQAGSSEFSLAGTESEMELDYYDYNVHNASAVPGSYLGMDPAYLIWIPPASPDFADDNHSLRHEASSPTNSSAKFKQSREEKTAFLGYIDPCSPLGDPGEELVALTQLPGGRSAVQAADSEKETRVEKCSSLIVAADEEDIKFADEDDDEQEDDVEKALVKSDDSASKKSATSLLDTISGKHIRT